MKKLSRYQRDPTNGFFGTSLLRARDREDSGEGRPYCSLTF